MLIQANLRTATLKQGLLVLLVLLLLAVVPNLRAEEARNIPHAAGETVIKNRPERVVALDFRYVEHLLALGIPPVGVADRAGYKRLVGVGADGLADSADVGTRQEPNLETIAALRPDLIIGVAFRHAGIYDRLSAIAPTLLFDYTNLPENGPRQLDYMKQELRTIADALGRPVAARNATERMEAAFAKARSALDAAGLTAAPFAFAQFMENTPKLRLFTSHSIAIQILEEIGLRNVWHGPFERFGFNVAGVESLAKLADAHFLHITQGSKPYLELVSTPVWRAMPFVRAGRTHPMPLDTWPFGGTLSAEAFVDKAVTALTASKPASGQ